MIKMARRRYRAFRRRARRSYGRIRRSRKFTLPLAPTAGIIAPFTMASPRGPSMLQDLMAGRINDFGYDFRERMVGVDMNGKVRPEWLVQSYAPMVIGVLVHKVANKLGINRVLANAKVPIVRV